MHIRELSRMVIERFRDDRAIPEIALIRA